jgi:hypothetical protein
MKTALLASVALLFVSSGFATAATPNENIVNPSFAPVKANLLIVADKGSDDGDSGDDSAGDDSNDDNGSANDDSDDDNDGDDDSKSDDSVSKSSSVKKSNDSGSGRKKPRIPGGSGCDDAGDISEHAACSAQ